jgi:hypothetical protein
MSPVEARPITQEGKKVGSQAPQKVGNAARALCLLHRSPPSFVISATRLNGAGDKSRPVAPTGGPGRLSRSWFLLWDSIGASRRLDVPHLVLKPREQPRGFLLLSVYRQAPNRAKRLR